MAEEWTVDSGQWSVVSCTRHSQSRPIGSGALSFPSRGRGTAPRWMRSRPRQRSPLLRGGGTAPRWMRCQHRRRNLFFPLSITQKSDLTANLSPALRAGAGECSLSVGSRCPRRKLCGGVPLTAEPLQPTPQGVRHPAPGRRWASPRRLVRRGAFDRGPALRQRFARRTLKVSFPTQSDLMPSPIEGKGDRVSGG